MRSSLNGITWPAIPSQRGAKLLALLYQLERSEREPADRLLERQLLQLAQLLQHAHETVPFYRERLAAAGYRPGDVWNMERLRALPVLTRREVQDAGQALWSTHLPPEHGPATEAQTTGSTGAPVKVRNSGLTGLLWQANTLRDHFWHRRDFSGKLAVIKSMEAGVAEGPRGSLRTDWGLPVSELFATGPCAGLTVTTDIGVQARWLVAHRPDYLLTIPSNLAALIGELPGGRAPALRAVRTLGEAVTPELRAACRDEWGAPLQDMYSSTEFGYIALQCPESTQYHVMAETVLVEVIAADGRPCGPGETGRIVVSHLQNFAMPLLRYEIGDYAEVGAGCPCGRRLPVLARIVGRERNLLTLPDGTRRWPNLPAERWADAAPVRQIQLVQESVERIVVRAVSDRELTAEEEARFLAAIRECLMYPAAIELERVPEIRPGRGGKFEQFLSRVGRQGS